MHAFIADVHLRPDDENNELRFISWLTDIEPNAEAVFILGDLFDYWYTGIESRFTAVLNAMESPKVHLMRGNRDFLVRIMPSRAFRVIPSEEIVIRIADTRVLLGHGHTLVEDDFGFRLLHRFGWPALAFLDRILPVPLKDRCARFLVRSSLIVRPNSPDIKAGLAAHKSVDMVICGHLHRYVKRPGLIVLPAFYDSGGWLSWDDSGPRLQAYP
jgi:UDP-2,3-diacylglucosamine hydrolase